MAVYSVTYRDSRGVVVNTGDNGALPHVNAATSVDVHLAIRAAGGQVISLHKMAGVGFMDKVNAFLNDKNLFGKFKWWVTLDEWAMLCDVLRALLSAGVPVLRALKLASSDASNPSLGRRLGRVADLVEKGMSLSGAMEVLGKKFPKVLIAAVQAGEKVGEVPVSLEKMATLFRRKAEIRREVTQALIYPVICVIVFVVVCGVITAFVPPALEEALDVDLSPGTKYFKEMKKPLQIIFSLYKQPSKIILPIGVVLAWFGLLALGRRMDATRLIVAKMDRRVPLFGNIQAQFALVDFIESVTLNQNSGIKISESLALISETTTDILVSDSVVRVRGRIVSEGQSFSNAIAPEEVFPGLLRQMISSAEAGGRLGEMLEPVANFYELNARALLKKMMNAMEPVMIVSLGLLIGPVVFSIYDFMQKVPQWIH